MDLRILPLVGILVIVFVAGCATTGQIVSDTDDKTPYAECDSCCPENKALLVLDLEGWGDFMERGTEIYFSLVLYNYGYDEARDVEVLCEIFNDDEDEYPVFIGAESLGNIASTSVKDRVLLFDRNYVFIDDEAEARCDIVSCENCEILKERIPELDE